MSTKKSISFYTLGCRLNQSETAVLTNLLETQGFEVVLRGKAATIAVINTCTVTKNSDTDTRRLVNRIVRLNPKAKIALIGCQSQTQKDELAKLPNVKWIVGNENKMNLATILLSSHDLNSPRIVAPPISRRSFTVPIAGIDRNHTRANIKIQDGCDSFCSFCEVPYARGRARSRRFNDIAKEAKALVAAKHKELILTGINLGNYTYRHKDLIDVITELENISGLHRIRISSIEPTGILDKLLAKMAQGNKLCRYLHIPLQSASDPILKLMGRKYTAKKILAFVNKAIKKVPEICIGTDVIVGFPGETDAYFEDTYKRLEQSSIHYFHVFSYSQRKMARSKDLPHKIDPKIIRRRSEILRVLGQQKRTRYYHSMLQKTVPVLWEQKKGEYWKGLTDNFIHVKVKSTEHLANHIINVKLIKVDGQEVISELG